MKTGQKACDAPLSNTISKGTARYRGVSRIGPPRERPSFKQDGPYYKDHILKWTPSPMIGSPQMWVSPQLPFGGPPKTAGRTFPPATALFSPPSLPPSPTPDAAEYTLFNEVSGLKVCFPPGPMTGVGQKLRGSFYRGGFAQE